MINEINLFEQKPIDMADGIMDWATVYPTPYDKQTIDPYTKIGKIKKTRQKVKDFELHIQKGINILKLGEFAWCCNRSQYT